jgi:hypothetical protein
MEIKITVGEPEYIITCDQGGRHWTFKINSEALNEMLKPEIARAIEMQYVKERQEQLAKISSAKKRG